MLVDWLNERMRPVKLRILNGRLDSHDEYLTVTGYCKGIHEVLDAPAIVAQLVENESLRREERKEIEE